MRPLTLTLTLTLLLPLTSAHGVVTLIKGANGVDMPGLSVADGTPRDCSSNRCGSQADTAIIRDREMRSGDVGPLGRTQGNGPVDAATMVANFMGGAAAPTNSGANSSVGVEDAIGGGVAAAAGNKKGAVVAARQLLKGLFGGGGTESAVATEENVRATAGAGAGSGLPTCGDDGSIEMVFHQINQDGAGPLQAAVDGTSGGTEAAAFKTAEVTQDVPGVGFQGLSLATNKDFPLTVQMPAGMTCEGTVAGVENVCVVRVRTEPRLVRLVAVRPLTQSPAARKRAIEYRLRRRAEAFSA